MNELSILHLAVRSECGTATHPKSERLVLAFRGRRVSTVMATLNDLHVHFPEKWSWVITTDRYSGLIIDTASSTRSWVNVTRRAAAHRRWQHIPQQDAQL